MALGPSVMDSALFEKAGAMVEADSASANWPTARRESFADICLCSRCGGQPREEVDQVAVGVPVVADRRQSDDLLIEPPQSRHAACDDPCLRAFHLTPHFLCCR